MGLPSADLPARGDLREERGSRVATPLLLIISEICYLAIESNFCSKIELRQLLWNNQKLFQRIF